MWCAQAREITCLEVGVDADLMAVCQVHSDFGTAKRVAGASGSSDAFV